MMVYTRNGVVVDERGWKLGMEKRRILYTL